MAEDYELWAKTRSDAHRVLLCEFEAYNISTDQVETVRLSTHAAGDYQYYLPVILKTPIMIRSVENFQPSAGFIEIDNSNGKFDAILYHNTNGREIRFFHGDASWASADFKNVFSGKITSFEYASDTVIRIDFSSGESILDKNITSQIFSSAWPEAEGKQLPICYGYCKNITPVHSNASSNSYHVSNGAVDTIHQVYIDKVPQLSGVTRVEASGYFTLNAATTGEVTCSVTGNLDGGVALIRGGEIIQHLLTSLGHLPIEEINTASITEYDASAPQIGAYFRDETNLLDAIELILDSHSGQIMFNRVGLFTILQAVLLETTTEAGESNWTSETNEADTPASGDVVVGTTIVKIHSVDGGSVDQSLALDKMGLHDEIIVFEDNDRWVDYRVTEVVSTGAVYEFAVSIYDQGTRDVRDNKAVTIRLTAHSSVSEAKETKLFINDSNLIGDIRIEHDPESNPTYKVSVGYAKNWTPSGGINEYYYVDKLDDRGEAGHKVIYGDSSLSVHNTLITGIADAQTEAGLRQALRADQHYRVYPNSHMVGFTVDLGDMVEITSARFKLQDQRFIIFEIEENMLESKSKISGWF